MPPKWTLYEPPEFDRPMASDEVEKYNGFSQVMVPNAIEFGPYDNEWYQLFRPPSTNPNDTCLIEYEELKKTAIDGGLRASAFRSVCWRVYLSLLPLDLHDWSRVLFDGRRRFRTINQQANLDPHMSGNKSDHPLSMSKSSSWRQHFDSRNVRHMIAKDVDRTFPEVKYFRNPEVREMMVNILFCYTHACRARYRQGMHEILAPICYVLHSDMMAFENVCTNSAISAQLRSRLSDLLNGMHMEADAYLIFERIMSYMEGWYASDDGPHYCTPTPTTPYYETRCSGLFDNLEQLNNPSLKFLENIHRQLLSNVNQQLYYHLRQLEIPPILFGLRWIRLLFGHEFPLTDLLDVWDCVFAIGENFTFVRYMYVAILDHWSHTLVACTFSECVSLLMRFPAQANVRLLIQRALNLYNPSKYPPPVCAIARESSTERQEWKPKDKKQSLDVANISGVFSGLKSSSHRRLQLSSLVRRRSLLDAPLFSRLGNNAKSAIQLDKTQLDESLRSNISGRSTPALTLPTVTTASPSSARKTCVAHSAASNSRISKAHLKCVRALEACNEHVDALCEQLYSQNGNSGNKENVTAIQSTRKTEGMSPTCRLRMLKLEIGRAEQYLEEIVAYGSAANSPSITSDHLDCRYDTGGSASMIVCETHRALIPDNTPQTPIRSTCIMSEKVLDRKLPDECHSRLGPPGAVIRMQLFHRKMMKTSENNAAAMQRNTKYGPTHCVTRSCCI